MPLSFQNKYSNPLNSRTVCDTDKTILYSSCCKAKIKVRNLTQHPLSRVGTENATDNVWVTPTLLERLSDNISQDRKRIFRAGRLANRHISQPGMSIEGSLHQLFI